MHDDAVAIVVPLGRAILGRFLDVVHTHAVHHSEIHLISVSNWHLNLEQAFTLAKRSPLRRTFVECAATLSVGGSLCRGFFTASPFSGGGFRRDRTLSPTPSVSSLLVQRLQRIFADSPLELCSTRIDSSEPQSLR